MVKMIDTLTLDVKVAGPDFIITTPKQLEEAFTLWNKQDNMTLWGEIFPLDSAAQGEVQALKLINLLRELNGKCSNYELI
jgi:hypothetical protein